MEHHPDILHITLNVSVRVLGASVKSKKMSNELLIVLGSRDNQWSVLDRSHHLTVIVFIKVLMIIINAVICPLISGIRLLQLFL